VACVFAEDVTIVTIPLTFDWLTLAWLSTRLSVWWRSARVSPRLLPLLLSLGVFSGCVPVTRFEEAQSAAQVALDGQRRAEQQIAQLQAENQQLRAQTQQGLRALEEREQALSQAELDSSTQGKQQKEAEGMVEQLRGELARVGGHLQTFHDDQQKLEAALALEATRGRALAGLARDLALALADPLATGQYSLDTEPGAVTLRVPREKVLAEDGSVKPEAEALLKAASRILQLHKEAKLGVQDSSAPGDAIAVERLVKALGEHAILPDRFQPVVADQTAATPPVGAAAPAPAPSPESAQIVLGFSVP
jgi:hypothetical protein